MRVLRFVLALGVAAALQSVGLWLWSPFASLVDLFLLLTVFHALDSHPAAGMLGGAAAGLTADALSGGLYGLNGFADTLVGYAVAAVTTQFAATGARRVGGVFVLAAGAQQLVLILLPVLFLARPAAPEMGWMLGKIAVSGGLGVLLHGLVGRVERVRDLRRQARRSRLRLGR